MSINSLKAIIEVQFKPSLKFYGKQYEIGNTLWETVYKDWRTDGLRTTFYNPDSNELCLTEYRRLLVINESIKEAKSGNFPVKNFLTAYEAYINALSPQKILRTGFRVMATYDNGMSFEELTSIMKPKFYPETDKLKKLTSAKFKDVALSILYGDGKKEIRLQTGPVNKNELLARTQFQINKNPESLGESSLFIDIDVSSTEIKLEKINSFVSETGPFIEKKLKDLVEYIFY